ncbi:hypothetical protein WDW89_07975 [Deltaproteobacteria bacterium TL4]
MKRRTQGLWLGLGVICLCWIQTTLHAETTQAFPQVRYVLESNSFLNHFPGETTFVITGVLHYEVRQLEIWIQHHLPQAACPQLLSENSDHLIHQGKWGGQSQRFYLQIPALQEGQHYCVQFRVGYLKDNNPDLYQQSLAVIQTETPQQGNYVGLDLGGLFSPDFEDMLSYVGVNFYLNKINKSKPLIGWNFWDRFSLNMGVTLNNPETEAVKPVLDNHLFLTGLGFRITDDLKLGMGALFYKKPHANPLVHEEQRGVGTYVSISMDIDLYSHLKTWNPLENTME